MQQESTYDFEVCPRPVLGRFVRSWPLHSRDKSRGWSPEILFSSAERAASACGVVATVPYCVWKIMANSEGCGDCWLGTDEGCAQGCECLFGDVASAIAEIAALPRRAWLRWPVFSALARLELFLAGQLKPMHFEARYPELGDLWASVRGELSSPHPVELEAASALLGPRRPEGDACSLASVLRGLAATDAERLRAFWAANASAHRLHLRRRSSTASVLRCLAASPERLLEWLLLHAPVFGLLERTMLPLASQVSPLMGMSAEVNYAVKDLTHFLLRHNYFQPTVVTALSPARETASDSVRSGAKLGCWQNGIYAGLHRVASQRDINITRPFRFIEVGAGAGECTLGALAMLGPSVARAVAFEPHALTFARLNWSLRANGFENSVSIRQHAVGRSAGKMTLCGSRRTQQNFYEERCGGAEDEEVLSVDMLPLADAMGVQLGSFDLLAIQHTLLATDILAGAGRLLRGVKYVAVCRCLKLCVCVYIYIYIL